MADYKYNLVSQMGEGGRQPKQFLRTGATLCSSGSAYLSIGETGILSAIGAQLEVSDWGTNAGIPFASTMACINVTKAGDLVTVSLLDGDGTLTYDILVEGF